MTQKRVADEKLGILLRREQDMHRRILQGTLDIDFVLKNIQRILEEKTSTLSILSSISLSNRITTGKYDWKDENINEKNFPDKIGENYKVEYRIFHFNLPISSDSAIVEMGREGFRPANIMELLKLGEIKPDLQREFPIVALGSIFRSSSDARHVPVLRCSDMGRGLDLDWYITDWSVNCRFLGVSLSTQIGK